MAPIFQNKVVRWCKEAFGEKDARDKRMRALRFIEEGLELVQATGLSREEAKRVLDYVYDRPKGEIAQEIGGTMVALAALVGAHDLSMYTCGENELIRCWQKIEHIKVRHANKPKFDGTDRDSNGDLWEKFYCPCGAQLHTAEQIKHGHCAECVRIRS